jgi:hypothetical protein
MSKVYTYEYNSAYNPAVPTVELEICQLWPLYLHLLRLW